MHIRDRGGGQKEFNMSMFNRKGFRATKAIDPKTGKEFVAPVRINSSVGGRIAADLKKQKKARAQANREYKRQLREAKKSVPVEMRSKVNWSAAINGGEQPKDKSKDLTNHDRHTLRQAKRNLASKMAAREKPGKESEPVEL